MKRYETMTKDELLQYLTHPYDCKHCILIENGRECPNRKYGNCRNDEETCRVGIFNFLFENVNNKTGWHNIAEEGYPYTIEEYNEAVSIPITPEKEEWFNENVKHYLLTDGKYYYVGFWRPDVNAWDNANSGYVWQHAFADNPELAKITHYMELPEMPQKDCERK